jgi:hypothetical protein
MKQSSLKGAIASVCLVAIAAFMFAQKAMLVNPPTISHGKVSFTLPDHLVGPLLPKNSRRESNQIAACSGQTFLELSGNFYCSGFCSGDLNPGPDPGSAAIGATVTYGVTPHSFNAVGNEILASGIMIDFGNGTTSNVLTLGNDQGVQSTTQYATAGNYNVQTTAVQEGNFIANDWNCHYRCCRYSSTSIEIQ